MLVLLAVFAFCNYGKCKRKQTKGRAIIAIDKSVNIKYSIGQNRLDRITSRKHLSSFVIPLYMNIESSHEYARNRNIIVEKHNFFKISLADV